MRQRASGLPAWRVLVYVAAGIGVACSPGDDRGVRDSVATKSVMTRDSGVGSPTRGAAADDSSNPPVTVFAARPAPPPARDADQDFLRHMLDHHETVVAAAHAEMMEPAGHGAHGTKRDPAEWDVMLDAEKLEMLALLKRHYGEEYSPRPAGEPGQQPLAAQLREGTAMTERFAPRLRRAEVRALARRLGASQRELAQKLEGEGKAP